LEAGNGHEECCRIGIDIKSEGDVNIYNCGAPSRPKPGVTQSECPSGPIAPGQCVPLAIGSKPKQSLRTKLDALLEHTPVPSSIASAFFQHSRRFLADRAPENSFEREVFGLFKSLSAETRSILACSVASFDDISADERDRLFDPSIPQDENVPLDAEGLAVAFASEIKQRVGIQVFGDPDALDQEKPGRNRFFDTSGVESFEPQLRICTLNGLRTHEFSPSLTPGDYLPSELQKECEVVEVDGEPKLDCHVQQGNCPGNSFADGTCLRVPEVLAGEAVVLEGVNFISVDAKVRLTAQPPGSETREVDALVFGDLDTPVTEIVDGQTIAVRDCRVHDKITFVVPADLPADVYSLQVAIPNVSGFPVFGDTIVSNAQYIRLVPPPTARFNISAEGLYARQETGWTSIGSDEVAVTVLAVPVLNWSDATVGEKQMFNRRFEDMDTGEPPRPMGPLFMQDGPMEGLFMTILAYEVDNERAYKKMIQDFWELFWRYLGIAVAAIAGLIAVVGGLAGWGKLVMLAFAHPILAGIAAALLLAAVAIVAAWAPADLIIADSFGFTLGDLDALTSVNFPMPETASFVTEHGLKVTVTPLGKVPTEYRERREYRSDAEDSRYEITLRYNRVA
jgi:hypothetical protein